MSDADAEPAREGLVQEKGFFILPSELFCNVLARADKDDNLNETLERVFNHIESSATSGDAENDFAGLFDDFDVNSKAIGETVAKRNKVLVELLNGVAQMPLFSSDGINPDLFGDAYEYLMGMYAANAGKKGGQYFTPADVSELLARLGTIGKTKINKVYDPACGSGSLLLKVEKVLGKDNIERGFYGQEIDLTTYNLCRINMFLHTNYSTDGDKFQNYYKDVSLRMKNKELDLLIVVNMFLTGFDATTLNTLWVDKNLKMHGLIQAYSRTNRILNSIKVFGNIVCFRNLQKRTDAAISLFGDKEAGGIVLMRGYKDYYFGYEDRDGKYRPGYRDMIDELTAKFPLSEERITGEQRQKEFIVLFGAILRMRNLLTSFDEFAGNEILSERDFQDYLGRYQDLRDEWKNRKPGGEKEDITDDIVFEIELIKQIEINIDYILMLVQKYHNSHCDDKEILITIQKAVDASPELRSKKALIETFIAGINDVSDVMLEWRTFVAEEKEHQLATIIQEENLKDEETRRFMDRAFRDGSVKTTGTDIDKLMPPISRFGGGNRAVKKRTVIEKLTAFFDRFFGIG